MAGSMNAPKRIWIHADSSASDWHSGEFKAGEASGEGEIEYIRADELERVFMDLADGLEYLGAIRRRAA